MSTGIYALLFNGTDKVYIGQSTDINNRWHSHISKLKQGDAPLKLQKAYEKYGEPSIHTIEECEQESLYKKEREYIIEFDSYNNGFNSSPGGEGGNTSTGDLNARASHTNETYIEVLRLLATSVLSSFEISQIVGVTPGIVQKISSGQSHKWLEKAEPELYSQLIERRKLGRQKLLMNRNRKYNMVFNPEGVEYNLERVNIPDFCKEHGLSYSKLSGLLNGHVIQYKGWHTGKYEKFTLANDPKS